MKIFKPDGTILTGDVWVARSHGANKYSINYYKNGQYHSSHARMGWLVFPPEVAVVFI